MKTQREAAEDSAAGGAEQAVIDTRCSRIRLGEDGILRSAARPGVEMTLADTEEDVATGLKIAGGRKVPLLIITGGLRSMSREARNYFAGEAAAGLILAQAVVVGSAVSRIIANFFLRLTRASFPTRLFTSEAEAMAWL